VEGEFDSIGQVTDFFAVPVMWGCDGGRSEVAK